MGLIWEGSTQDVGDTAVQLELERIGRALESAAVAFNELGGSLVRRYDSGELTISVAGTHTLDHGLGGFPDVIMALLVCKTDEHGYVVGDEVALFMPVNLHPTADVSRGAAIRVTTAQLRVQIADGAAGGNVFPLIEITGTAGNFTAATNANWRLRIRALRFA